MLNILHITDIHMKTEDKDQEIVLRAAINDMKEQVKSRHIDIVIISGDLVYSGEEQSQFEKALTFIEEITKACNVDKRRVYVCPGNHDISTRQIEINRFTDAGLSSTLNSEVALNSFVDEVASDRNRHLDAFSRLKNFTDFSQKLPSDGLKSCSPLHSSYLIENGGFSIGIACFNTAWRCSGKANDFDRGKLLLGERAIDLAVADLSHADLRIAIFHHPTDYLAQFQRPVIERSLLSNFDMLFFGHVHLESPASHTSAAGRAAYFQGGALYSSRGFTNSYQYIELDLESRQGRVIGRSYFDNQRSFRMAVDTLSAKGEFLFSLGQIELEDASVKSFLRVIKACVREAANRHVTLIPDPALSPDNIDQVFVCPPLIRGKTGRQEVSDELGFNDDVSSQTLLTMTENSVVYGRREAGKTSLAHWIAVYAVDGLLESARVPLIIDAKSTGKGRYGFDRAAMNYLSASSAGGTAIKKAIENMPLLVILDNFIDDLPNHQSLLSCILEVPNVRIICFATEGAVGPSPSQKDDAFISQEFVHFRLGLLNRQAIRELAEKRRTTLADTSTVYDTIMTQLFDAQLPRNGYVVSLLLWAQSQNQKFEKLNEAVLIENIVGFLLGKWDFTLALRKEFDARSKELFLQSLAIHLTENADVVTENSLIIWVVQFFKERGLEFSAAAVLDQLISAGILTRSNDCVEFRYRCFQEYFFACAMREDAKLFNLVGNGDSLIMYSRELDLLTSLTRKSNGLITNVLVNLAENAMEDKVFQKRSIADTSFDESKLGLTASRRRALARSPLSLKNVDDMFDKAEQKALEEKNERKRNLASNRSKIVTPKSVLARIIQFNRHITLLELLGRLIRNSEFDPAFEKEQALTYFLGYIQADYCEIVDHFESAFNVIKSEPDLLPEGLELDDVEKVINRLKIAMLSSLTKFSSNAIGSEKLNLILTDLFAKEEDLGKKFIIATILFDLKLPHSLDFMIRYIKDIRKHKFLLNAAHEKLCVAYDLRLYRKGDKNALERAITELEESSGRTKKSSDRLIQLRDAAARRRNIFDR